MAETFRVSIDGGPDQQITVATGVYHYAAAAVPALFDLTPPLTVKIWSARHAPEYGPYWYRVAVDEFGGLVVTHLIPPKNYPR